MKFTGPARLVLLGALVFAWLVSSACVGLPALQPTPLPSTATPEPLVPTPLPSAAATVATAATAPAEASATGVVQSPDDTTGSVPAESASTAVGTTDVVATATVPTAVLPDSRAAGTFPFGGPPRGRVGLGFATGMIDDYEWGEGAPGWWLNWFVAADPPHVAGSRFAQMVRFNRDTFKPNEAQIAAAARANPGSLWLMGNEPDVAWQDNAAPEQYAATYGRLYPLIKAADPTALIAIAGVSQSTPLRLAYLDRVLAAYRKQFGQEMPVDVWNIHAFVLREERDSWGVGIPPGMTEDTGRLYEIADHADMNLFRQQIVEFRQWMAGHGLRDKPLVVSEYGILMPESYGFPPDLVAGFMADTFDYFLTAADPALGYPEDDNRLVQAFCWYSNSDTVYPTPSLFDAKTKAITPVGEMFTAYVAGLQ